MKLFTQGLSREVGTRGITVNNVQPGPIDTDLNPVAGDWAQPQIESTALKRYGTGAEIAAMVAFVAGPEASYITGANLMPQRPAPELQKCRSMLNTADPATFLR